MGNRSDLLDEAKILVTGDRNNAYGPPSQDFLRSADMMTALGFRAPDGGPIRAHHVAMLMALIKLSRLVWSPLRRDSWTDLAGYAACGFEAAVETLPGDPGESA